MTQNFLKDNTDIKNHCLKCVHMFKELGDDLIKIANTNLVSELTFSCDI